MQTILALLFGKKKQNPPRKEKRKKCAHPRWALRKTIDGTFCGICGERVR